MAADFVCRLPGTRINSSVVGSLAYRRSFRPSLLLAKFHGRSRSFGVNSTIEKEVASSIETHADERERAMPDAKPIQRFLSANLLFAGACPLLCKSTSRLRQKVDNGGIVA